jgi:uncharacterized RDD family membrane protein YckC
MSEHPVGVTGEAVVLELRLAKLASRSLALAIDLTVQLTLFLVGTLVAAGALGFVDDTLSTALALVFYVLVVVGYPVAMETATRGRTLGKMALGLRVVREDGGSITFRHAFVRGLLSVVEIWITVGSVALVTSLASAKGCRADRSPWPHPARGRHRGGPWSRTGCGSASRPGQPVLARPHERRQCGSLDPRTT